MTVSDRDAFLTTRRLAQVEGILAGGSGGLAVHAALEVAREIEDPKALIAVILPDGGRSYLSKVYSDAWMRQYGFLERGTDLTVGDVLGARGGGRDPAARQRRHPPEGARRNRAPARAPRLAAAGRQRARPRDGRRRDRRARAAHARRREPELLDAEIVEVMEPPFPAVSAGDPVREAVELLVGDRQALMVTEQGRAAGIVTRADLLEALAA